MNFHFYFSQKFGLFHVDFNDPERKRTAKKSAEVYSQIIKSNKIPVELLSVESSQWHSENFGSSEFDTLFCSDSCEWICWTDGYGNFYISGGHSVFHSNIFGVFCGNLARR